MVYLINKRSLLIQTHERANDVYSEYVTNIKYIIYLSSNAVWLGPIGVLDVAGTEVGANGGLCFMLTDSVIPM